MPPLFSPPSCPFGSAWILGTLDVSLFLRGSPVVVLDELGGTGVIAEKHIGARGSVRYRITGERNLSSYGPDFALDLGEPLGRETALRYLLAGAPCPRCGGTGWVSSISPGEHVGCTGCGGSKQHPSRGTGYRRAPVDARWAEAHPEALTWEVVAAAQGAMPLAGVISPWAPYGPNPTLLQAHVAQGPNVGHKKTSVWVSMRPVRLAPFSMGWQVKVPGVEREGPETGEAGRTAAEAVLLGARYALSRPDRSLVLPPLEVPHA